MLSMQPNQNLLLASNVVHYTFGLIGINNFPVSSGFVHADDDKASSRPKNTFFTSFCTSTRQGTRERCKNVQNRKLHERITTSGPTFY